MRDYIEYFVLWKHLFCHAAL